MAPELHFTTKACSVSSESKEAAAGKEGGENAVSLCSRCCLLKNAWFREEATPWEAQALLHRPQVPWPCTTAHLLLPSVLLH